MERSMVRNTRRRSVLKRQKWPLSRARRVALTGFLGVRTQPSVFQKIPISH
jgi:hypothetical protein